MIITHVIPGLTIERGGPSTVVAALTRHQANQGHRVTVLTTDQGARNGEHGFELDSRVTTRSVRVLGPDRVAFAPQFAGVAKQSIAECDVVHVHSIFTYPVHAAILAAKHLHKPLVLRPCGLLHPYSLRRSRFVKQAYLFRWGKQIRSACAAWHYTSVEEARCSWPRCKSIGQVEELSAQAADEILSVGDDGDRCFVLPNGIDPEKFAVDRNEARKNVTGRWPQIGNSPYVLFLGRIHPKKRLDLLVDAFLKGAPGNHKLVVAGPDEAGIWNGIQHRFLAGEADGKRVVAIGSVSGHEKADLLAGAKLFALPSEHENFGIAALEAMAAGTRAVLSPHVDLVDGGGVAGVTIVSLDVDAWAGSLRRLLATNSAATEATLREFATARFGWSQIASRLTSIYETIRSGCEG